MCRWHSFTIAMIIILEGHSVPYADEKPKKELPRITVAADKTPFKKEIKFTTGEYVIVKLPNGKEVALWTIKDPFPAGEQTTKSGLQCLWGEVPFKLEVKKDSYIRQGSVTTEIDKTTERELFIGEWQMSYISDLTSEPHLNVTIIVRKRDKTNKDK